MTDDKGSDFTIHFLALFSKKSDAIPLIFLHGWPGSILEFLGMLTVIKKQYPNPEDLPYHIIVPSLPGYAFSSSPPIDRDFKADNMAPVMNALMVALGFGSGYIAQGGDLGSFIARQLGVENEECKGIFAIHPSQIKKRQRANLVFIAFHRKQPLSPNRIIKGLSKHLTDLMPHSKPLPTPRPLQRLLPPNLPNRETRSRTRESIYRNRLRLCPRTRHPHRNNRSRIIFLPSSPLNLDRREIPGMDGCGSNTG